ncbi:MAG: hypothetical protein HYS21_06900 [Deltaproteobacteria bacterium]|nr:hypothetical protein [Deltaproteobacteria bacterium]
MMPKYVCKKCNHEFYGWGVYYQHKAGSKVCPDCEGGEIEEKKRESKETLIINGTAA